MGDEHSEASSLVPPASITELLLGIDLETGSDDQIQCQICLETDGRDFITPCKCKRTAKYVHGECLDHWRAAKEGFAFAHCTTCKAPYYLRVHVIADRKWRTLKFRFFVTRDILFIFIVVQLVITLLAYITYLIDGYQKFWLHLTWDSDSEISFCYICVYMLIAICLAVFVYGLIVPLALKVVLVLLASVAVWERFSGHNGWTKDLAATLSHTCKRMLTKAGMLGSFGFLLNSFATLIVLADKFRY